ncbi:alanine racemase [Hyphococcus sp.]|uniref:alanine racemase n=1 Tax=Hyphococcus sp. TaxID=2038636 RepID=UPI003D14F2A4
MKPPVQEGPHVEIDLGAVCANFAMILDAAPGAAVSAAVKCNAYGLGAAPIARALHEREKCDEFFVVYAEEGLALREALGDAGPRIYCFAGPSEETLPIYERAGLTPVINSLAQAELWAKRGTGPAAVHIDTGMNRLGAPMTEAAAIAAVKGLDIPLVMSHLACASDPAHPKNAEQRAAFIETAQKFPGARLSLSASAGALMDKAYQFDLVRPGIALYGGSPFDEDDARICAAVTLKAPVVQLRDLAPGETVGYGAAFSAKAPTRIATVALGYGDGYPRNTAPAGAAIVNGAAAPIAGRISMDFITLDVTGIKNPVKIGDYAEFFGSRLRLFDAARATGRATYDLLTGLGGRIDRRYL